MMTLDEAIKHCKDVALSCTNKECALEHFQLLKWLQEYSNMLEKQGVQKPQRMISAGAKEAMYNKPACVWSEEDEVYLNTTIAYLKDAKDFKKTAENCIDWLKKLKQRIGDKL